MQVNFEFLNFTINFFAAFKQLAVLLQQYLSWYFQQKPVLCGFVEVQKSRSHCAQTTLLVHT